jgi:hypothetical protein
VMRVGSPGTRPPTPLSRPRPAQTTTAMRARPKWARRRRRFCISPLIEKDNWEASHARAAAAAHLRPAAAFPAHRGSAALRLPAP